MAQHTRIKIKEHFQAGDIPSEGNYVDLIDSYVSIKDHNSGSMVISGSLILDGHITASGNISASGTIYANNFTSTGGDVAGISFNDDVNITGSLTASGNISSSGIITGEGLVISDDATIADSLSVEGLTTLSASTVLGTSTTDTHQFMGHITMSGDISASGDLWVSGAVTSSFISASTDVLVGRDVFVGRSLTLLGGGNLSASLTSTGSLGKIVVDNIKFGGTEITSTGTEINYLDGVLSNVKEAYDTFAYDAATGIITLTELDNGTETYDLGVGTGDSPTFYGLTLGGRDDALIHTWDVESTSSKSSFRLVTTFPSLGSLRSSTKQIINSDNIRSSSVVTATSNQAGVLVVCSVSVGVLVFYTFNHTNSEIAASSSGGGTINFAII
mgnify:CR=1 FL=1